MKFQIIMFYVFYILALSSLAVSNGTEFNKECEPRLRLVYALLRDCKSVFIKMILRLYFERPSRDSLVSRYSRYFPINLNFI